MEEQNAKIEALTEELEKLYRAGVGKGLSLADEMENDDKPARRGNRPRMSLLPCCVVYSLLTYGWSTLTEQAEEDETRQTHRQQAHTLLKQMKQTGRSSCTPHHLCAQTSPEPTLSSSYRRHVEDGPSAARQSQHYHHGSTQRAHQHAEEGGSDTGGQTHCSCHGHTRVRHVILLWLPSFLRYQ